MLHRVHRTLYITDMVEDYKQNSMVYWEEIINDAYNNRDINRFISNNEYKMHDKHLTSCYMECDLYEKIMSESSALHMTFSKYMTLLLHDYVSHHKNVSRETF